MTTILLDSADPTDVAAAVELGFVRGVTTNPTLMRKVTDDPVRHAGELLSRFDVPVVYYQPTGAGDPADEAREVWALDKDRVVVKLPATPGGVAVAAGLVRDGVRVSLTAAQSAQAMIVAESVGCASVIPYVDRAQRDQRTDNHLVRALARVRRGPTAIVAASIKSTGQLSQAVEDGADAVSAPLPVLTAILTHPAALEAELAFAAEYPGS